MISLNCYYPAENPRLLTVKIDEDDLVTTLAEMIQTRFMSTSRIEINFHDIRLYKADLPIFPFPQSSAQALQWLHRQKEDDRLQDWAELSSIFPDGASSCDRVVHIIVSDPEVSEMTQGLGDPKFLQHKKLRQALHINVANICPVPSPSKIIGNVAKIREFLSRRVYLGRPGGAPAAIFNPALAALQRRLDNLDQVEVTRQDVLHAADYLNVAIEIYDSESAREMAIKKWIDRALDRNGDWNTKINWAGGIAPYMHFQELCNFLVVLIGITENRIDISIAVCVGEIHVTQLLTLDLTAGFLASDNIVCLARIFQALSLCQEDLALYYGEVEQKTSTPFSSLYPNLTPADSSDALPLLNYKHLLSKAGEPIPVTLGIGVTTSALYIATLADQEVVVKFNARCNGQAHRLLAESGFAPTLHLCKRVVGGLYMVVMDRVFAKSLWQLQHDKKPIPTIVVEQVRQAIHLLHEKNIVFGDLRDANILYDTTKSRAVLVDLDWAGIHGVDKYPPTLNIANGWPSDVGPYGPMLKDHDLWQLNRLEGLCTLNA